MKIKQLTTLKHKLQWLVLLAALLGVSQGVCGTNACGSGWKVTFSGASTDDMHTTSSSYDLGTLSDIYDKDLNISKWESWWSRNDGNLCGTVIMYWKVDNGTESNSTNNHTDWDTYSFYNDNPNIKVADKYFSVGEHTLDVRFTSSGSLATSGDCQYTVPYPSSGTFQMTFTVPAPTNIYITGDAAGQSWGNWIAMTKNSTTNQWYKSVSAGTCKISFKEDYENDWYNNFTADNTRSVGSTVSKTSDGYNNISIVVSSGYEDPVLWIDVETRTFWAVATASCTAPSVTTTSGASSVTNSGATLKGTVTITSGDCEVTDAGIAYGTSTNPTTPASYGEPTSEEEYEVNITGLSAGTRYYYRAYVTAGGVTTYGDEYSFYTRPDNLYIKGVIIYDGNGCDWPWDNNAFTRNGNVFTKTITARKPGCSYSSVNADAEFVLSPVYNDDSKKLNGKTTFAKDGDSPNWDVSSRDDKTNFKYTASYNAGEQVLITVTFVTDGTFKMKLQPACNLPTSVTPSATNQCLTYVGSNVTTSLSAGASGGGGFTYAWEVTTNPGNNASVSPDNTANTTATFAADGTYVFTATASCPSGNVSGTVTVNVYSITQYAVTSSADAAVCPGTSVTITLANTQSGYTYELYKDGVAVPNSQQARSVTGSITWTEHPFVESEYSVKAWKTSCDDYVAEMSNSVTVSVKGDLALSAEPIEVTPYQPVALTVTGTSIGDLVWTTSSSDAAIYGSSTKLVTTNENPAIFKAPEGTYTVTITATDDGCPNVSKTVSITVNADSEDC